MTLQIMHSPEQILRANAALPGPDAQQHMVLLNFSPPVPKAFVWEFNRIKFTLPMLAGGEEQHFQPEIIQPHTLDGACSRCSQKLTRIGVWDGRCDNARCPRYRRLESLKPKSGVIRVDVPGDRLRLVDGQEVCDSVVLILDRRYRPEVLAAVYRTAGMICDQFGWKLL